MAKNESQERIRSLQEVLSVLQQQQEFESAAVKAVCEEANPRFVTNVLKQLSADNMIGRVQPSKQARSLRYTWLVDRRNFDCNAWIDTQVNGTQVRQAPAEERPRERLLEVGAQNLKNSELLAILIRSGLQGESAVQAGQKVAKRFAEGLENLPQQSSSELKSISPAVSKVAYCQIMAGIELGRRIAERAFEKEPLAKINSTQAAIEYCRRRFIRLTHDATQEEFHIVTLDTKLQPIQTHQITVGTLDASLVHPREVFKAAIRDSSSAILLVHNHPSGDPTPSRQDHQVTERLKKSGEILGINVIDHIIVARRDIISLAEWD